MPQAALAQEKYYETNRGSDLRRAPEGEGPKHWVVSEMWELHHEIVRLLVLGLKNTEIAAKLGCSTQTVSNVRNSPVAQEQITIMRGARDADTVDLAKEIIEIAPVAMNLLKDIIRGENDGVNASIGLRAKEANGMLARAGFGVPQRVQSESVNVHLTSADIANIKDRARSNSDIIDVN
jgi:hypothetical protein